MFPIKGIVFGPGGKFRGRQLERILWHKKAVSKAAKRYRLKVEGLVVAVARPILTMQNKVVTRRK